MMPQGQLTQGSFGDTSTSSSSLQGTAGSFKISRQATPARSSTPFIYPSTSRSYLVRSNGGRATRRRRRCCTTRWIVGSVCIFCFALLLSGSLWLLLSFYASENLEIGENNSRLFSASSLFVKRITVTRIPAEIPVVYGPVVYRLSAKPALDQEIGWTEVHDAVVSSNQHQEWAFWLNRGSHVVLQHNISDPIMEVLLVVIRGEKNLQKWVLDLSNSDPVSSWKIAKGFGNLEHHVDNDHNYYFALGNIQSSSVKVTLQISLESKVYNTENYKSRCYLTSTTCAVHLNFLGSDVLLLTTPQNNQGILKGDIFQNGRLMQQSDNVWNVNVAFEQRWITYLVFWGSMAILMLILLVFCRPVSRDSQTAQNSQESVTEATPLTTDEVEDKFTRPAKIPVDFEDDKEISDEFLCIICFEAQRSCFFDPCGHCATCYSCSMKILKQKKSLCPLCREPIRFVRRLFLR